MPSKIATINIKGKEYATVVSRVNHFRQESIYKNYSINTEVLFWDKDKDQIIIRATIFDNASDNHLIIASGIAHEEKADRGVNATSYVENCETSAIGRALACLGIGVEDAYASAFEVEYAIDKQNNPPVVPTLQNKMEVKLKLKDVPAPDKLAGILHELNSSIFTDVKEEHLSGIPKYMDIIANPNRTVGDVQILRTFCKYYDNVNNPSNIANANSKSWKLTPYENKLVREHITFLKSLFDNIPFESSESEQFEDEISFMSDNSVEEII
tara:strand:- start:141 stop:947 length:807 start_codon:yes stop_codon:yes gene_type:complete